EDDSYFRFLNPELEAMEVGISKSLEGLSRAVGSRRSIHQPASLSGSIAALDRKASAMRGSGVPVQYPLEEILRVYSFVLSLKNLAADLDLIWVGASRAGNRAK
ncbi:MAG: hypothetical protein ACREAC_14520, partial [Blastocatellia bacterium]